MLELKKKKTFKKLRIKMGAKYFHIRQKSQMCIVGVG